MSATLLYSLAVDPPLHILRSQIPSSYFIAQKYFQKFLTPFIHFSRLYILAFRPLGTTIILFESVFRDCIGVQSAETLLQLFLRLDIGPRIITANQFDGVCSNGFTVFQFLIIVLNPFIF